MSKKTSALFALLSAFIMCLCGCNAGKTMAENNINNSFSAIYEKDGGIYMLNGGGQEAAKISDSAAEGSVYVSDDSGKVFFREKDGAFYIYDATLNKSEMIAEKTLDAVGLDSGDAAFYIKEDGEELLGYSGGESFKIASGVKSFAFDKEQKYIFYETDNGIGVCPATDKKEGKVTDGREKISFILKDENGDIDTENPYIIDVEKGELKKFSSDFQSMETVSEGYVVNAMIHGGALYVFKQVSEADEYGNYLTNLYRIDKNGEEICAAGISGTECSNVIYKNKKRLLFVVENAVSGTYTYCSLDESGTFAPVYPVDGKVSNLFCSNDGENLFVLNSDSVLYEYKIGSDGAYKAESKKQISKNVKYCAYADGVCQIYTTDGFYIYDGNLTHIYEGEQSYANTERYGKKLIISDKFANGPLVEYENGKAETVLDNVSDYIIKGDGNIYASVMRKNDAGVYVYDLKRIAPDGAITDIADNITKLLY